MTKVPDFPCTKQMSPLIAAGIAAATAAVTAMARRESSSSGMAEEDVI